MSASHLEEQIWIRQGQVKGWGQAGHLRTRLPDGKNEIGRSVVCFREEDGFLVGWGAILEGRAGTPLSHASTVVSAGTVVPAVTDHQNQLELSRNQALLHPQRCRFNGSQLSPVQL